jgi:hypothetical protein
VTAEAKGVHTRHENGYKVTYWIGSRDCKIGSRSCKSDEKWTRAVISTYGTFPVELEFDGTDNISMRAMATTMRILDKVYESGKFAAKQELRDWLGVSQKGL